MGVFLGVFDSVVFVSGVCLWVSVGVLVEVYSNDVMEMYVVEMYVMERYTRSFKFIKDFGPVDFGPVGFWPWILALILALYIEVCIVMYIVVYTAEVCTHRGYPAGYYGGVYPAGYCCGVYPAATLGGVPAGYYGRVYTAGYFRGIFFLFVCLGYRCIEGMSYFNRTEPRINRAARANLTCTPFYQPALCYYNLCRYPLATRLTHLVLGSLETVQTDSQRSS